MRRAVPVIAATAGALALLANFHTRPAVGGLPSTLPTSALSGSTTTAPPTTTTATTTTQPPVTHAGATAAPTTAAPVQTAPPTTAAVTRAFDGPTAYTDYGPVQVRVTIRGGTIVDVQALQLPSDRSRSQQIAAESVPILRSEALRAQSARIDSVSGASYTSAGYIQSLQGAIDRSRA
jgi:uncharacterized protein with FMN-binding domain